MSRLLGDVGLQLSHEDRAKDGDALYARGGSNIRIAASVTQKTRTERVPLTGWRYFDLARFIP